MWSCIRLRRAAPHAIHQTPSIALDSIKVYFVCSSVYLIVKTVPSTATTTDGLER